MERRSPSPETPSLRSLLRDHLEGLASAGVEILPRPRWVARPCHAVPAERQQGRGTTPVHVALAPSANGASGAQPPRAQPPHAQSPDAQSPDAQSPDAQSPDAQSPHAQPPHARPRGALLFDVDDRAANLRSVDVPADDDWQILRAQVAACTLCSELAATRKQTVFGVGNLQARLCFLGEAPGADEDRMGEPFVGRAGQLLNKIREACGLERSEVFILNVLKCRPPGNRLPAADEAQRCRPFLDRQLALIQPEFICCLGAVAAQNLLGVTAPIGILRGKPHAYRGIQVYCTYHPAYLLRNPSAKKSTWEDMKLLMRAMGRPVG